MSIPTADFQKMPNVCLRGRTIQECANGCQFGLDNVFVGHRNGGGKAVC
jgi:hypothetical protein